jgi:hypothetical protein
MYPPVFTVINWLLPSHFEKGTGGNMFNRLAALLSLASLALPVVIQECELYISVQQRCFPGASLAGATISVFNPLGKPVFNDVTNIQGSRRVVMPDNEEYTVQITADGYSPENGRNHQIPGTSRHTDKFAKSQVIHGFPLSGANSGAA